MEQQNEPALPAGPTTGGDVSVFGWTIITELSGRYSIGHASAMAILVGLLGVCFPNLLEAQIPAGPLPVPSVPSTQERKKPTVFRVKYVGDNTAYLEAGRNADLQEGMKLSVVEAPPDGVIAEGIQYRGYDHVAELVVSSVSDSSAVCEVMKGSGELKVGQAAFLTPESVLSRHESELAAQEDQYPIVMTFTYGDPLDEEIREEKETQETRLSPMQRMRGRIGFDYGYTSESGGFSSRQMGLVIDADMQNIGGTYWNFIGAWRGNIGSSSSTLTGQATQTLTDLVNRTYRIGFTYQSPYSPDIMGIGRQYLPWAPSLSTIDGGYFGRKLSRKVTVGLFAGSTPDPSSWSYNPDQRIAGTFLNFEQGSFDRFRIYSTMGLALTTIQWKVARQFAFFENTWSWKQFVSFYNSTQADAARISPLVNGGSNPNCVSQSYSTLHFQPIKLFGFGVNYNYFRTLPTFDPRLLGTGLLDQYLFQGFSGDVRFALPKNIGLFVSLGKSNATTDTKSSLNQAYGISMGNIANTGIFADVHYSKFDSSFGSGKYTALSLSKSLTDALRLQVYGGHQVFNTVLTSNTNSNFVNGVVDWNVGSRYFLEGNIGWYRGTSLNYTQWTGVFGYRLGGFR
jgi:hypothetical protein